MRQYTKPKKGYEKKFFNQQRGFKTLTKPSLSAIKQHKKEMEALIDQMRAITADEMIRILNPKIQGWANYYRRVVARETFQHLDHWLWQKLWRWAVRRHPKKGRSWVADKYYKTIKGRRWRFVGEENLLNKYALVKIERHLIIRQGKIRL